MEVQELKERLEEFIESYGPEAEVRIASQPSWPFEYDIKGCVDSLELGGNPENEEDSGEEVDESGYPIKPPTFYIVEGAQLGYFRKDAWDVCC